MWKLEFTASAKKDAKIIKKSVYSKTVSEIEKSMNKHFKLFFIAVFASAITVFSAGGSDIVFQRNIDLSVYKSPDMTVNLQDVKWRDSKIYVALHYLDNNWEPAANSLILEMNETGNILREFESNFPNVYQIEIRENNLFVIDRGSWFGKIAGGITKIDLVTGSKTTVFDGETEGRSPIKIEFVSDNEGFLLTGGSWGDERIAKFVFEDGKMVLDYGEVTAMTAVSSISYNKTTEDLWFARQSRVYRYSLASQEIEYNAITSLPTLEIISVGDITLTIESNYSAGRYGLIVSDEYRQMSVIDGDAGGGFADGNFYILERSNQGALIFLTGEGEIVKQLPFDSRFFNPHGIAGNGKGDIFAGSKNDLTIAVFTLKDFEISETSIRNKTANRSSGVSLAGIRNGEIYLNLREGNYTAELYNLQGRMLLQASITAINGVNAIGARVDNFAKGILILNVKQDGVSVLRERVFVR